MVEVQDKLGHLSESNFGVDAARRAVHPATWDLEARLRATWRT